MCSKATDVTSRRLLRLSRKLFGSAIAFRGIASPSGESTDSRNCRHLLLVLGPVAVQVSTDFNGWREVRNTRPNSYPMADASNLHGSWCRRLYHVRYGLEMFNEQTNAENVGVCSFIGVPMPAMRFAPDRYISKRQCGP
jgi:hypothetical protein